ncbi:gliding motility lipoprotein GldH [Fulvivirga lutea]|uniref:Gliding motility lipoprotein GldH n=1 Tax=Fulvivirga lutea TaxID=2810512 RepID=A0A974WH87_9BACT|nr:gliding motility lipoprotein GldH [Fulvivirga lutea]QSE98504.1 gliding motility lipoprotein GldH [Fulvivirga lutea]
MKYFYLLVILAVFSACDENRVFEQNADLDNKIWMADSTLNFQFNVPKLDEEYNLYFNIRNTVAYPYENIYITYSLSDTLNNQLKKELVNYNLFDPKTGEPYGDGLGDVFDHQLILLENFKFEQPGPYKFQLQQYMRMDSLPEIISAGIRVEKVVLPK